MNDCGAESFDLQRLFDDAVSRRDESEAIIFGSDLLNSGKLIHVMVGFKKLAVLGFEQSRQLYISLAYRLSALLRRQKQDVGFFYRMQINELRDAIEMFRDSRDIDLPVNRKLLKCELMCWYILAWDNTPDDEATKWSFYQQCKSLMKELNLAALDSEYRDFLLKYSHWF